MVLCAQKDEEGLDLDSFVQADAKSSWPRPWEIAVNRPAAVCGKPFQPLIERDIATPIFGLPIRQ